MSPGRPQTLTVVVAVFALGISALSPSIARAEKREDAKVFFNAGVEAFEAGQFLAAVQAFEQARHLIPHPAIIFSIAQSYKRQFYVDQSSDHARRAIAYYRSYLEQVPQGGRRADAAQAIGELEMRLNAVTTTAAPPPLPPPTRILVSSSHTANARISLDDRAATEAPLILEVTPGKHTVTVTAEGYFDDQRELVAVEGALVALDAPLRGKPAALTVQGPSGAEVQIDARPQGVLPLPTLEVPAGRHLMAVAKNGRSAWSSELQLGRGEARLLRVDLHLTGQRRAAHALLAVGAAGLATSGLFAGLALRQQFIARDIEDELRLRNVDAQRARQHDDAITRRDDFKRGAWIALGVSGGIAATALVLMLADTPTLASTSPREEAPPPPSSSPAFELSELSLLPVVTPGLLGLAARGRL